jgi:pheromone a factor receptor
MWRLYKHRKELQGILREKGTRKSHFYRLILIALILTIGVLPIEIQAMYLPLRGGLLPFNWTLIHSDWEPLLIPTNGTLPVWYGPVAIILGFITFICYGLGRDAVEMYKSWLRVFGLEKHFPSLLPGTRNSTANSSKFTWTSIKKTLLRTTSSTPSYKDKDSM